jgi:hypothetical protein
VVIYVIIYVIYVIIYVILCGNPAPPPPALLPISSLSLDPPEGYRKQTGSFPEGLPPHMG